VVGASGGDVAGDVLGQQDVAADAADKYIAAELEVASEPASDERFECIEVPAEQAGGRLTTQHVDMRGETVDVCDPAYPAVRPVGEEEEVGFDFWVDPQLHASRGAAELGDADVPVGAESPAASWVAELPLHGDADFRPVDWSGAVHDLCAPLGGDTFAEHDRPSGCLWRGDNGEGHVGWSAVAVSPSPPAAANGAGAGGYGGGAAS